MSIICKFKGLGTFVGYWLSSEKEVWICPPKIPVTNRMMTYKLVRLGYQYKLFFPKKKSCTWKWVEFGFQGMKRTAGVSHHLLAPAIKGSAEYPMGTHWFWDPISSPKRTRPKFLLRFWGLSKSEETPAFLPFTSCNATAKMRDSTWDSAASQCRRVYFETDLKFPMPNFHFHSELFRIRRIPERINPISCEHSACKPTKWVGLSEATFKVETD